MRVFSHSCCIQLFVTLWTVTCQALLSIKFSRQETGVGSHSLLQGIFLNLESNLGLLHCRQILYHLSYQVSGVLLLLLLSRFSHV